MTSESFGCHDISRHRWGASARWQNCCFSPSERTHPITVVAYGVVRTHCTKAGCYWTRVGCTLGRWGLRAVRTTLGQWIPTLVEQADSGRLKAEPASNHDHRSPAQTSARERCRRTCDGGAGMCRKNPGLTPALPGVHSADITETAVKAPSGDRWNTAVSCQARSPDSELMSALWTPTPRYASPLSLPRLLDHQPAQGSHPSECLRTHDTHMSPKREDSTNNPGDEHPAQTSRA